MQVQGNDTGQGGSRSEVILGAAERGFAARGYKKVYTRVPHGRREAINKDEIPGGYRFYVQPLLPADPAARVARCAHADPPA